MSRRAEVLVEHEVQVAVAGVTEDHRALVAVRVEQLHQALAEARRARAPARRRPRAARSCPSGGRRPPRSRGPCGSSTARPAPWRRWSSRPASPAAARQKARTAASCIPASSSASRACSSTRSAACSARRTPRMAGGHFGSAWATRSDWASSSSAVATPVATIASTEAAAACRSGKTSSPVATCGQHLEGAEDRRGDEAERALAADREVDQHLDRVVVVEQRVEPVAHRVLEREQPRQRLHRGRVGPHPVAQTQQAGVQRGLGLAQHGRRRRGAAESTTVPEGSTSTIDSSVR